MQASGIAVLLNRHGVIATMRNRHDGHFPSHSALIEVRHHHVRNDSRLTSACVYCAKHAACPLFEFGTGAGWNLAYAAKMSTRWLPPDFRQGALDIMSFGSR